MRDWIYDHKPAAPARVQILLAAVMWTVVGGGLAAAGIVWSLALGWRLTLVLVACGTVVGLVKSHLVLDRAAGRILARIVERGDGRCAGGFLSVRSWGLVVLMAVGGRLLRGLVGPTWVIDLLYVAVGVALLRSSRLAWRGWRRGSIG